MAGNKAAAVAPGWPLINGDWMPASLFKQSPLMLNFIGNPIMIHFIHRNLAYLILLGIFMWTVRLFRSGIIRNQRTRLLVPMGLTLFADPVGYSGIITSPGIRANQWVAFDWLALLHQLNGMLASFQPDLCDLCVKAIFEVILIRSFR